MHYKVTITFVSNEAIETTVSEKDFDEFITDIWKTGKYTSKESKRGFAVNPSSVKVITYEELVIAPPVEIQESKMPTIGNGFEYVQDLPIEKPKRVGRKPGRKPKK